MKRRGSNFLGMAVQRLVSFIILKRAKFHAVSDLTC